jgi:PAS domain S-box-containing protein
MTLPDQTPPARPAAESPNAQAGLDSATLLDALLERTPMGFAVYDRDLRYLRINSHLAQMNGLSIGEHLGRSAYELIPGLADEIAASVEQVWQTREAVPSRHSRGETRAEPGSLRHWISHWFPLFDASGEITACGVVVEEITERVHGGQALEDRTRRLDLLARLSNQLLLADVQSHQLTDVLDELADGFGFEMILMYRADVARRTLTLDYSRGVDAALLDRFRTRAFGEPLCGLVAGNREALIVEDIPSRAPQIAEACGPGLLCYAGFPLLAGNHLLGTIAFGSATRRRLEAGQEQLLHTVCDQIAATLHREHLATDAMAMEERLRLTLAAGGVVVWEFDPRRRFTSWVGDTASVYGRTIEEMPVDGDAYNALIYPDDREATVRAYREAIADGRELRHDFRVLWPNGEIHWIHGRAFAMPAKGSGEGRVIGINTNVTERFAAASALRESEQRLRLSMDAAYLVAFTWNLQTDEVHRLHGWSGGPASPPEQPQRFADVAERVHPADRAGFEQRIQAALSHPEGYYENEFRLIESDGSVRWYYERGTISRDSAGNPVSLSGLSQDVTARKSAEEALRVANLRKDEFLATLAHELRNPLAPIRSAVEVLRMLDRGDPQAQRATAIIDRQVTNMVRLVDDLLDVNRITRGDIPMQMEVIDIARVVHAAVETSRPVLEAARHDLRLSLPFTALHVRGDAARLSQALSNLLNNAARYTPPGGQIELQVERQDARIMISVTDNGRGIDRAHLDEVFEMFTRLAPDTSQSGLGIGLPLVRRIVQMHQGDVRARSDGPDRGSTFEVWLPLYVKEQAASSTPRPPAGVSNAETERALRILIVDDNVDSATSQATMLELRHHVVCVVHDAQAALDVVHVFDPDVALLDIGLPGMNGYELAQRIRGDESLTDMVLVAQTGWGQPADRERALSAGFNVHLTKPVDWTALQRVLADVGARHRQEAAQS